MKITHALNNLKTSTSSLLVGVFLLVSILGAPDASSHVFDLGDSLQKLDKGERLVVVNLHGFDEDKVFLHLLECDFKAGNFTELQIVFPDNGRKVQDLELTVESLRKLISEGEINSGTRIINGSYLLHYSRRDGVWAHGAFRKSIQLGDSVAEMALAKNEPELNDEIRTAANSEPQTITFGDKKNVKVVWEFIGPFVKKRTVFLKGEIVGKLQTLFFDQDLLPKLGDKDIRKLNGPFPNAGKMYLEKNEWLFKQKPFGFQLDPEIGGKGVKIIKVFPNSKAEEGGLKANETIKTVNGTVTDSVKSILQLSTSGELGMVLEVENVDGVVRTVTLVRDAPLESIRSFFD